MMSLMFISGGIIFCANNKLGIGFAWIGIGILSA